MNFENFSTADLHRDTLLAIKENLKAINGGDLSEPVYCDMVKVSSWGKGSAMKLSVIFCDDNGVLRGDLVSSSKRGTNGAVFGQNLEGIEMNDLIVILKSLQNRH